MLKLTKSISGQVRKAHSLDYGGGGGGQSVPFHGQSPSGRMDDSTCRSRCSIPLPSPLNYCHRQNRQNHPSSSSPAVLLDSSLLTPPVDDSSICASPPHNDDTSGSSPGVSNESEDAVSEPLDFSKKRRRKQQQEQIVPQISVPDNASSMLGLDCFTAFPSVPPLFPGPLPPALLACPLPLLGLLMRHAATVSAAAAGRTLDGERGVSDGDLVVSSSSDERPSSVPAQDQYACFRQRFLQQLSQQQQQQLQQQQMQQLPQQRQQQQQDEEDLSNSATSPTSSLDLKGLAYLERRKDILYFQHAINFGENFLNDLTQSFFLILRFTFAADHKTVFILFEILPCI